MTTSTLQRDLIERHIRAEMATDVEGAVAVYTPDVAHDVVGWPTGVAHGPDGARGFYGYLTANFVNEAMDEVWVGHGDGFCTIEHLCTGTVPGELLGVAGNGRRITFRMLHVFEFEGERISREQVWLDGGSIIAQLAA